MELFVLILIVVLVILVRNMLTRDSQPTPDSTADDSTQTSSPAETRLIDHIYKLNEALDDFYQKSAYPADLLENPHFKEGVKLFGDRSFSSQDLLGYYTGVNLLLSSMAMEALAHRKDDLDILQPVLARINGHSYWPRFFALRALDMRSSSPILAEVLVSLDDTWEEPVPSRILQEFTEKRLTVEGKISLKDKLATMPEERVADLELNLKVLGENIAGDWLAEVEEWQQTRVDVKFLHEIGRVIYGDADPSTDEGWIEHAQLKQTVDELEKSFNETPSRSVVLVGTSGVGKTAVTRVLARRLVARGWVVFEAGAVDLLAGQMYIGQLEERVQQLVRKISGKRKVLWLAPNFHEFIWAGSHKYSPTTVLDMIFPFLDNGAIHLLGETRPAAYEKLAQYNSRIGTSLDRVFISPLPQEETLALAAEWSKRVRTSKGPAVVSESVLGEAFQLTQQYMSEKAAPGSLLTFLDLTWKRLTSGGDFASLSITLDDLLVTLSQLTGLPLSILDDREGLDLKSLREFFLRKVMGQAEAVDCLVERVAMIKAGLTDPGRPQGVFLFAGPTGTGKTEIAKTLAEFLFGSENRMIRLDMSEFKTADALDRLIGNNDEHARSMALVDQIRKQPFSVVLLDEFEKANPNVWDLFLQVFDDGRLTDRKGNTADFRHCIIIMTSNLGALIPKGSSIGFTTKEGSFTSGSVTRAIEQEFRKEFINRIDRIVVFRPLSRTVMRAVLHKELNEVLQRRGLRNRTWAVEWHESAVEFLLDKGFTSDLGARPLKRAIDRYLLSPLAMSIVNHQFPEGEQFMFVRSSGKAIEVEFIDPEAGETTHPAASDAQQQVTSVSTFSLPSLILEPGDSLEAMEFLRQKYELLTAIVQSDDWSYQKQQALARTSEHDFWNSPERFEVLGLAEYMDRIEAGLATAGRLLNRLIGPQGDRTIFSSKLTGQFAHQLYLLDAACSGLQANLPQDAFIRIKAGNDAAGKGKLNDHFARRIGEMYQEWARRRRMRYKILEERESGYCLNMAVGGYAAYAILQQESGLHVWEIPSGTKSFQRYKTLVEIVPQPPEPAGNKPDALLKQSLATFDKFAAGKRKPVIVRRYREEPSPLIRDSIRDWRTGRLDRVLGGDFDLIE